MKTIDTKFINNMKIYLTHSLIILSLLFLTTCTPTNLVEVTQTNFKEEVTTQSNLKFTFNKSIVGDTLFNVWDTTAYIQFTPKVEGKFKWVSANEIVFSPEKGFSPSTDYQAKLSPKLASKESKLAVDKDKVIKFHTTYLSVENSDVFWSIDERRTNQLRINLNFNYKVDPNSLQSLTTAMIGEEKVSAVKVLNQEPSKVVELLIEELNGNNLDEKKLMLSIAPGVKCTESSYISDKELKVALSTPNKNQLKIEGVLTEYENFQPQIYVKTNQSVSLVQVLNNLKIEPKMVYEVRQREDGFVVKGNFKSGGNYTVSIDKSMQGVFGSELEQDFREEVLFGDRQPVISFVSSQGVYLSSKGNKNIGIRINNVPKVKVVIYKIYENNLVHFLRGNEYGYGGDNQSYYQSSNNESYGDIIIEEEYDTKTLPLVNDFRVLNLDFAQMKDPNGVYTIRVSSTEDLWLNSSTMVSLSDIGFIARETKDDIYVFANSLMDSKAMNGLKISLISQSNQVIATANTDNAGVAVFSDIKKKYPDSDIRLITARSNDDFNYLSLSQSRVDKSRFETDGYFQNLSGYMAFLYGERDLYRPGEQVNLNVIVRNQTWNTAGKMPIILKFKLPNGKDLVNMRGTLDNDGAFNTSISLPASAVTGIYQVEIYTATNVLLNSMPINVEEFMPDRIKVKLALVEEDLKTIKKDDLKTGDLARVQLSAVNLFGPPASDRNYQMGFSLVQQSFTAKAYTDYNFGLRAENEENGSIFYSLEVQNTEGKTDSQGKALEEFTIPKKYDNLGLLQGRVYATVFDETGRSVSRQMTFDVFTQPVFLGIKSSEEYVSTQRSLSFSLIALTKDQSPVSSKAIIEVIRFKWQTVLEKDYNGRYRYVSKQQEEVIKKEDIQVNQGSSYNFTPLVSGDYEVRLRREGAVTFVSNRFYAYGYGNTNNTSFEVDKDGKVEIKFDKKNYQVGEQANILFTTPFNGRLLVTVERDKVMKHFYLDTKNKSASTQLTIEQAHLPNVFITATLIKPVSDGAIPLTVAHGFEPLPVKSKDTQLDLSIQAVEKSESKQKQTIIVKTGRPQAGVQVTLAVVDEGILQLKNYQTPQPHDYFFQKRGLVVQPYDLYPQLFPEISIGTPSTGGGGDDFGNRANPMVNRRVKLVRFWSGVLQTNSAGEVSYTIDIPQFSGSLRIMAVAYKDGAFGSASKNMTIADPMVISTGLPRFLSPGDKVKIPVTLSNTTEQAGVAQVQLKTTDNLKINSDNSYSTSVKANQEGQVEFEIEAKSVIDSAKVEVVVQAFGRTFTEKLDINIRPITGLTKQAGNGLISSGKSKEIDFKTGLLPSTVTSKMWVSKSPLIQFTNDLEYLIQYPHGCVEQITSSVFPQLYAQELMKAVNPTLQNTNLYDAQVRENVQEGIMRLLSMQSYSGGLQYWPSGYEESWFGTAYGAHFMIEAQKIGYNVPQSSLDQMLVYLRRQTDNKKKEEYYYYDAQDKRRKKFIAPKEAIYSLYVLALAKQPDVSLMNYYKENKVSLALDSKYLLATSYLLLGDKESYQSLLPTSFEGERSEQVLSGSFHSYIRDEALALNSLIEGDPENPQVAIMAQELSTNFKNAKYLNTQECAFTILALGKLAKQSNESQLTAQVLFNGATVGNFVGQDLFINQNLANGKMKISTQGQGNLYYFWQMQGLDPSGKVKEEDNKLKVRKTFYDSEGNVIKDLTFRQNDLVVVKVSITADPYFRNLDNVVVTDMLPAGFEIENPRLTPNREIRWIRTQDSPQHFDIRDDRINYFVTATGKTQNFYYLARAVSKGSFKMGPVSADAMYDGNYYSYYGSGTVNIVDRVERKN